MRRARLPVAQHPGDVQVFDHDRVEVVDEAGGELVGVVAAQVRHPSVQASARARALRHRFDGSTRVRRSGPRCRAQCRWTRRRLRSSSVQAPRVGHVLAGGQRREVGDAEVDADDPAPGPLDRRGLVDLDGERDVPPPTLVGQGGRADAGGPGLDLAGQLAGGLAHAVTPMTGSCTWRRSRTSPNAPVVNRQLKRERRFDLKRGIRARPPRRFPRAVDRFAHPDEYASLLFSAHHGAASSLAAFHAFRRLYAEVLIHGVSWSPVRP